MVFMDILAFSCFRYCIWGYIVRSYLKNKTEKIKENYLTIEYFFSHGFEVSDLHFKYGFPLKCPF
jgi:hypothetical protein